MNRLKPYSAYKNSDIPWLGKVPEDWEIKSLGSLTRPINQRGSPDFPLLSVVREKGVILRSSMSDEENRNYVPDDLSNYKVVRKGNLVINKMKAWQGSMGIASQDGIVSPAYFVYDFNIADLNFGHALLRSKPYVALFGRASDGVRVGQWDLSPAGMKRIPVVIPPLPEQTTIVHYLDYMDRRIRHYINAKKKLIALLNEQKQAIIYQAVTRGLDPNVRLKPSGVEWLADIPEHWEEMLNQRLFKEVIRPHDGESETQLSLSQRDGLIATSTMQERSLQTSTYENWKVTIPGDLVLNRFKAHLGVFFSSTLRGIVSFHYGVFAPRRRLITKYFELLYHTNQYKTIYAGRSNGMTVGLQNLSNQNFYNVRSVVPPVQEQAEIVSFTQKATEHLNNAIGIAKHEIELLLEYRTCLIADVVTGKLEVREAAANLPEEAEQPEDIEELTGSEGMPEEVALEPAMAEATDED